MSSGKDSVLTPRAGGPLWSDRWVTGAFLLFLSSFSVAAAFLLFRDGKGWVLLIALVSGALLWALEHLETRYLGGSARAWNPLPGYLAPVIVISLAVFVVCLPTVNSYFLWDDFLYIHLFRAPSLSQFLRLFHTDLSQGLWGIDVQELRPLYGLSYMLSYSLWGLHPLGYHVSCMLLHFLNSVMVFLIARRVTPGETWAAGFAGLLFAALPVHWWVVSSPPGALTEGPPTLFYLSAFLCFVCYRSTGLTRYLVLSTSAFAACLLSKETAVTLPVMLISYDLFRMVVRGRLTCGDETQAGTKPWWRLVLAYVPFVTLLLAYLGLRRIAFSSFLKGDTWETTWGYLQKRGSGPTALLYHLAYLGRHVGILQAFNLRQLLLPFPTAVLGLVLGLYLIWALSLLRCRSECHRSLEVIVYFGVVWYLISNAPLVGTYVSDSHLYIPSVGFCIAIASVAAPACSEIHKHPAYLRLLGAGFLVCLCACQLWKADTQVAGKAEFTARVTGQLAAALGDVPKQTLVIIPVSEGIRATDALDEALPYALQEPFRPVDLYSRARIIEDPYIYCCPLAHWWEKTKRVLTGELAGAPEEQIEINLLAWDDRSNSLQRKKRVLPKKLLQACVTQSLGRPVEKVESIGWREQGKLVEALAKLVSQGRDFSVQE